MPVNQLFDIDITGIAETQKKLFQFSQKLARKTTILSLKSGAQLVKKAVIREAPKKTGRLRRSVIVRVSKINTIRKRGKIGVFLTIKKGKKRDDKKGAYYAQFVENGHRTGKIGRAFRQTAADSRAHVRGRFFVKRAFKKTRVPARRLIIRNIETAGLRLTRELGIS